MSALITDQAGVRTLTNQVAEDFAWLEQHARNQPGQAPAAGNLHLAGAMVRNVVGPFLDGQPARPLHVAVVGGAGAGKSTITNLLCGQVLAESNPQAGFTRHPIAYVSSFAELPWPAGLGFLGPLHRLNQPEPANLDDDVYQVRRVGHEPGQYSLLENFVVWDCPDMTTWAATGYVPRLMEVAALADVIVYVASDERYNDEVPTQFLRMFLAAGKAVVVCLVKMKASEAPAFVEHFRKDVLSRMPHQPVAVLTVPHLTADQLADPVRHAAAYRVPLINQLAVLSEPINRARQRTVRSAVYHLRHDQPTLFGVARDDLQALEAWRNLVQEGQIEFDARYRREYLTSARFRRFDEALVRLLDMLELPGVGRYVSGALYVLRTPYRLLKGLFAKAILRPENPGLPEQRVLEEAWAGWLDLLRKEAVRRGETHSLWQHVARGFSAGLADQANDRFQQSLRGFQLSLTDEVERTARAIYEDLERHPLALNVLRGTKFTLEIAAIGSTVAAGGINWGDVVLIPFAASVTHWLVEIMGKQYVDYQREQARARQQALATQYVSGPLAEWLTQWPTSGGSAYERLQLALRRLPTSIQQMETLVELAMK
jgi:hypothetical protein